MKIAVCDSFQEDREKLFQILSVYLKAEGIQTDLLLFETGEQLLKGIHKGKYSMIFLEIMLDGINGLETARKIREVDDSCAIFFVTQNKEFGVESYEVDAWYYFIKPITKEALIGVMKRHQNFFTEWKTLRVLVDRVEYEILIREILYIEVFGKQCIIYTRRGKVTVHQSLSALEAKLPKNCFFRISRYQIVNYAAIKRLEQGFVYMEEGKPIPVSRREWEGLCQSYLEYQKANRFR